MRWDETRAVGPVLFESGPRVTGNLAGYEDFSFETGGLQLSPGAQYIAFLSESAFFDGTDDDSLLGSPRADVYPGGDFYFLNNGSNFDLVTSDLWTRTSDSADAAFRMSFVPEPVALVSFAVTVFLMTRRPVERRRSDRTR